MESFVKAFIFLLLVIKSESEQQPPVATDFFGFLEKHKLEKYPCPIPPSEYTDNSNYIAEINNLCSKPIQDEKLGKFDSLGLACYGLLNLTKKVCELNISESLKIQLPKTIDDLLDISKLQYNQNGYKTVCTAMQNFMGSPPDVEDKLGMEYYNLMKGQGCNITCYGTDNTAPTKSNALCMTLLWETALLKTYIPPTPDSIRVSAVLKNHNTSSSPKDPQASNDTVPSITTRPDLGTVYKEVQTANSHANDTVKSPVSSSVHSSSNTETSVVSDEARSQSVSKLPEKKPETVGSTVTENAKENSAQTNTQTKPSSTKVETTVTENDTDDKNSQTMDNLPDLGLNDENNFKDEEAQADMKLTIGITGSDNPHFFAYFMTMVILCIIGYLLFHNKQKIIALVIEGRNVRGGRRRPSSAAYHKLDNNLEEAMISSAHKNTVSNIIY